MPADSFPTPTLKTHPELGTFLQNVREIARLKHLSIHTENAYAQTIRRFLDFHGRQHPAQLGPAEVRACLTHLAVQLKVAAATHNVALNSLAFLYNHVLNQPLGDLGGLSPAPALPADTTATKTPPRKPSPGPPARPKSQSASTATPSDAPSPHTSSKTAAIRSNAAGIHPHRPGTPRPRRRQHHHDLYEVMPSWAYTHVLNQGVRAIRSPLDQ